MLTAYGVLGFVLSLGVGLVLRQRLAPAGYRYDDEQDVRRLGLAWVPPLTAVVLPLVAVGGWRVGGWSLAVLQTAVALVLIALSVIDLDVHRLPDRITQPLLVGTALGLGVVVLVGRDVTSGQRAVFAALGLGAFYFVLAFLGGGAGMGFGDVKLAPTLGLLLGFHSWSHVVVGTTLAFVTGTVWGVAQMVRRRGGIKSAFAFGPHMIGAALLLLMAAGIGPLLDRL